MKELSIGLVMQMAGIVAGILLAPLALGLWLDRHFGTVPLFMLAGASVRIIAGTIAIGRVASRRLEALGKLPETRVGSDNSVNGKEDRA